MLLLFALLFTAVIAGHFFFARQAWLRLRGAADTAIDLNYIRRDDWLAQSFRSRLVQWTTAPARESYAKFRTYNVEGVRLVESDQSQAHSRLSNPDIYAFTNDFACVPESNFGRELSVQGNAQVGANSRLQSITAGGSLKLGAGAHVARWADSDGELTLGPGAHVGARATSRYAIRLSTDSTAKLVSAPVINTDGYIERVFDRASVPARGALQFPLVKGTPQASGESNLLAQMEDNCLLVQGDLHFSLPVEIRTRLVVRGSFSCPSGSLIHEDIKAEEDLSIGPESLVTANLVAGRNLALFDGCQFEGVLHAGKDILLATGVRGRARRQSVAAYATEKLYVETNVSIEGKLAAGQTVRAVKFWRK